jgi:hypothetical protein
MKHILKLQPMYSAEIKKIRTESYSVNIIIDVPEMESKLCYVFFFKKKVAYVVWK